MKNNTHDLVLHQLLNGDFNEEKWEKLGFLEGLNDEQKTECAERFTEMAKHLMSSEYLHYNEIVETVTFPLIRRAIQNGGGLASFYTPEKMCRFITVTFETLRNGFWILRNEPDYDIQAECCAFISELFYKNRYEENN